MTLKRNFLLKKIIRDKMFKTNPDDSFQCVGRQLNPSEALPKLKEKLLEEVQEVMQSTTQRELVEELGDVLEVVKGMAKAEGVPYEVIQKAQEEKREARGGFEKCYYVEYMILSEGHPKIPGLLAQPDKYPEIVIDSDTAR